MNLFYLAFLKLLCYLYFFSLQKLYKKNSLSKYIKKRKFQDLRKVDTTVKIQNNFVKISCFAKFQKCCFAVTLNAASLSFSFVFLFMFSCRVGWSDFHVVLNCIRNLISKFRFLELVFA